MALSVQQRTHTVKHLELAVKNSELSVTEARVQMSRIVRDANNGGVITYLTNNGLRVAAIVPVHVADAAMAADSLSERAAAA